MSCTQIRLQHDSKPIVLFASSLQICPVLRLFNCLQMWGYLWVDHREKLSTGILAWGNRPKHDCSVEIFLWDFTHMKTPTIGIFSVFASQYWWSNMVDRRLKAARFSLYGSRGNITSQSWTPRTILPIILLGSQNLATHFWKILLSARKLHPFLD